MSALRIALWVFTVKDISCKPNIRLHLHFCTMRPRLLHIGFSPIEICWSSRKSVILRRQLNKNIKLTMLQRRMNNWNTVLDRGIKCLERLSCVHTSGIGAFYTFGDIFRRTSDRLSGIRWCWYPAKTINENRRRVLTKLSNYFVCTPICDSRLCDALLPFPSDGLLVTRLLTCSDAHKLRRNEL